MEELEIVLRGEAVAVCFSDDALDQSVGDEPFALDFVSRKHKCVQAVGVELPSERLKLLLNSRDLLAREQIHRRSDLIRELLLRLWTQVCAHEKQRVMVEMFSQYVVHHAAR